MDIQEFKRSQPIQPKNLPYIESPQPHYQSGGDNTYSSTQSQDPTRTFIFGELSQEEQAKFFEFMIKNNVQFTFDPTDAMYVATVKIVNKNEEESERKEEEGSKMSSRRQSRQSE
jgi:hypothetical protein